MKTGWPTRSSQAQVRSEPVMFHATMIRTMFAPTGTRATRHATSADTLEAELFVRTRTVATITFCQAGGLVTGLQD